VEGHPRYTSLSYLTSLPVQTLKIDRGFVPVRVVRWVDAIVADVPDVVRAGELRHEVDLPYGEGEDHAEGIALLPGSGGREVLVVYDGPSAARLGDDGSVLADAVRLP
jgi:hypothetical protein